MAARVRALIILFFLLSSQTLLSAEYRVKGICFAKEFPARDAMILFVLEPGMQVTAIRENNEWIYVTSPQNSGSRGWVLKEALLRKSTETAAVIKPDSIGIIKPTATLPVINENEKPHPTEGHQDKKTAQKRPAVALTLIIVLLLVILYPVYSIFQILKQNKRLKQSRQPQTQPPEPQLTKTSVATDTGPTKPSPPKPSSPHISPNAVKTAGEIPAPAPTTSAPGPSKSLPNVIVTPPPSKRQSSNGTKGPVIASGEILKPAPAASAPGPSKPLPNVTITPPPSKRPTPSTSTSSVTPTKGTRIQTPPGSAPVPPAPIPTSKRTPPPPEPPKPRLDGDIEINEDFQRALDLMEKTNRCIFITGKAGTGKSTLLKLFVKSTKKQVALLAPTGIAALNIGGRTLHSFFKFPPRMITEDDIKESHDKALYRSFDTIIIDEISMVRTDMLDSVDKFLRKNGRDQNKPFGGIQLIFFGDLFQLSPIAKKDELAYLKDNYGGVYFFHAPAIKTVKPLTIQLQKVYRQKDSNFIYILDSIRTGSHNQHILNTLNERLNVAFKSATNLAITLTPTNARALLINKARLDAINSRQYIYKGFLEGEFPKDNLPTEMELPLKVGAQVMFVKNDMQKRWVNGTIGEVVYLAERSIKVRITANGGGTYEVLKEKWEIYEHKYDPETKKIKINVIGSFSQIPLKLAWAITINKSQGLTFDNVIIDLDSGAFACGQTYVALSRCRSLDGIILHKRVTDGDIRVDPEVVRYMENPYVELR